MSDKKLSLNIKSAEINFIYSFLAVCNFTLTDDCRISEVFPENSYVFPNISLLKRMFPGSMMGNPIERTGALSAYLSLQHNIGYETLPSLECKLFIRKEMNDEDRNAIEYADADLALTIEPTLRFFPTGCSCNMSVWVNKNGENQKVDQIHIHKMLRMVRNIENKDAKHKLKINPSEKYPFFKEGQYYSIHDLFKFLIMEKEKEWFELVEIIRENSRYISRYTPYIKILCKDYLRLFNGPISKSEFKDEQLFNNLLNNKIIIKYDNNSDFVYFVGSITYNEEEIKITNEEELKKVLKQFNSSENDEQIILRIWRQCHKAVPEPQYPWAIINIELNEKNAFCESFYRKSGTRSFIDKQKAIRKYENLIAPLIYRSPIADINEWETEPAYLYSSHQSGKKGIYNMFLNSQFFVHITRRSIFSITDSFTQKPASFVLPTLKNISETTHSRWQTLVILNKMMDETIRRFSYNFMETSEKLEHMISMINLSSSCLEDPNTYVVSGNAVREIYDNLISTFKLNELSDVLIKKINLLEKVYQRGAEKDVYKKYDRKRT